MAAKLETIDSFILVAGRRMQIMRVRVPGRKTVVKGLVITPEFEGWDEHGKPKLNPRKYRVGSTDGYALAHFKRLKDAMAYLERVNKTAFDFRPPRKGFKTWQRTNPDRDLIREHFTIQRVG